MAATDRRLHWLSVVFPDVIDFPGNEGLIVPSGTTAQRPPMPTNGLIRYNVSGGILEAYINGIWENLLGTGGGIGNEFISLIDTFSDYAGRGNNLLRVNAAETAIESLDIGTGFLPNAGGIMDLSANITMASGELLGLPATPSVPNAATSKTYVDSVLTIGSRIERSNITETIFTFVDTDYSGLGIGGLQMTTGVGGGNGGPILIETSDGNIGFNGGELFVITGPGNGDGVAIPGNGGRLTIRAGSGGFGGNSLGQRGGSGGDLHIESGGGGPGYHPGIGGNIFINAGGQGIPGAGGTGIGGNVSLTPGVGDTDGVVYIGLANLKWPNTDGAPGTVLTTDGAGNLSFATPTAAAPQAWTANLYPGSRANNTTYTNSTGSPITVNVIVDGSALYVVSLFIDGVAIVRHDTSPGSGVGTKTFSVVVPDGSDYKVTSSESLSAWYELS